MDVWQSPWANEKPADHSNHSETREPIKVELQADGNSSSIATVVALQDDQTWDRGQEDNALAWDKLPHGGPSLGAELNQQSRLWELDLSHALTHRTDSDAIGPDLGLFKSTHPRCEEIWDGKASRAEIRTSPSVLYPDPRWSTSPKLQFATVPEPDVLNSLTHLNSSSSIPTPTSARAKELIEFFEAKSATTRPGSANDDRQPQAEDGYGSRSSSARGLNALGENDKDDSIAWPLSHTSEWISPDGLPSPMLVQPTHVEGVHTHRSEGSKIHHIEQGSKTRPPGLAPPSLGNVGQGEASGDFEHSVPVSDNQGQQKATEQPDTPSNSIGVPANPRKESLFPINMDLVAQLYPPDPATDHPSALGEGLLSSTSACKTWYRISRQGTMGKYDSGNEDYVRVSWVGSAVQASVKRVVAEWITEDQFGGRSGSGDGNGLSSLFGWGEVLESSPPEAVSTQERPRVASMARTMKQLSTVDDTPALGSGLSPRLTSNMLAPHSPNVQAWWDHTLDFSPVLSEVPPLSVSCSTLSSGDPDGLSRYSVEVEGPKTLGWCEADFRVTSSDSAGFSQECRAPTAKQPLAKVFLSIGSTESKSRDSEANYIGTNHDIAKEDDWGAMVESSTAILPNQLHNTPGDDVPARPTAALTALNTTTDMVLVHASPTTSLPQLFISPHMTGANPQTPGPPSSIASISTSPIQYTSSPIIPERGSSRKQSAWSSADSSLVETPAPSPKLGANLSLASQSPLAVRARKLPKTAEEEAEEAEMLGKIVRGLPDLSYMLNR